MAWHWHDSVGCWWLHFGKLLILHVCRWHYRHCQSCDCSLCKVTLNPLCQSQLLVFCALMIKPFLYFSSIHHYSVQCWCWCFDTWNFLFILLVGTVDTAPLFWKWFHTLTSLYWEVIVDIAVVQDDYETSLFCADSVESQQTGGSGSPRTCRRFDHPRQRYVQFTVSLSLSLVSSFIWPA